MKTALAALAGVFKNVRERFEGLSPARRGAVLVAGGVALLGTFYLALCGASAGPAGSGAPAAKQEVPGEGTRADRPSGSHGSGGGLFSFETPEAVAARLREQTIRQLERDIRSANVSSATVMYTPGPAGRTWITSSRPESAAVKLLLAQGVLSLPRQEAEAIRALVSCALKVDPERIAIVDNHGRLYAALDGEPSLDSLEDEDYWRQQVRSEVNRYYGRLFDASEFHVSVAAYVSRERVEIQKEEYDPSSAVPEVRIDDIEREEDAGVASSSGGLGPPGEEPLRRTRVKSKTEERYRATKATIRKQVPRGELRAVGVNVLVDANAVLRTCLKGGETALKDPCPSGSAGAPSQEEQALLSSWSAAQEADLRNLLKPYKEVSVRVIVHPFSGGAVEETPSPRVEASAVASAPRGASGFWLAALSSLAVGSGALACWFLLRTRGRSLARPPLSKAPQASGACTRPLGSARAVGLLAAVEEANARVRARPEVASAVVRFWLSQESAGSQEGAVRA